MARYHHVWVGAVVAALTGGGCGLVWVPALESCPDPVLAVEARDAATGALLPDASVCCYLRSAKYKRNDPPHELYTRVLYPRVPGERPGAAWVAKYAQSEDAYGPIDPQTPLTVTPDGPGRHRVGSRTLLAGWQLLWPLGWGTSGDWMYHGHQTVIVVDAAGHAGQEVEYSTACPATAFDADPADGAAGKGHSLRPGGVLAVFLKPLPQGPWTAPPR